MLVFSDSNTMPQSFKDSLWDSASHDVLESWLMANFQRQLCFAVKTSNFWKKRIPDALAQKSVLTRADIEQIPLFNKQEMRLASALDLVSDRNKPYYLSRGSGGTTGVPTQIFWSYEDWRASIEPATRFLARASNWQGLRVWNGYHQGHVAGPAFDDFLRSVGATPIPRHFKGSEEEAIAEMERLQVSGIVLTPQGGSGKGGSLEDFLSTDPNFIARLGIKSLLVSSTELKTELLDEVRELGIETIVNLYGSTEALPTGISCKHDPQSFHICQGHVFLEVIGENGCHVQSGKRGKAVVSRIGATYSHGIAEVLGTQIFRFVVGDSVTFIDEPCPCGLKTPKIADIKRMPSDDKKILGGCEQWD